MVKVSRADKSLAITRYIVLVNCFLNHSNGTITIPAGTECNHSTSSGHHRSVRLTCNYAFNKQNAYGGHGDDSTAGTGRAIVWTHNMIIETDMYDTSQMYPRYANLYVEHGLFTTKLISPMCKCIGFVLIPPGGTNNGHLRALYDPAGGVVASAKSEAI